MQDILSGYLNEHVKITKVKDHSAAGTSPITSDELDMTGYDGVVFLTSLSVPHSANNYMTFGQGLTTGAEAVTVAHVHSVTSGAADMVLDVQPTPTLGKFVNVIVTVGTSSTVESIWAIQYCAKSHPVTSALVGYLALNQFSAPALV